MKIHRNGRECVLLLKETPQCEFYLFYSSTLWPWWRLDRLNRFQPFCFSCVCTEDVAGSPSSSIILTILLLLLTFRQQLFFLRWQLLSFLCDALLPPTVSSVEFIPPLLSQHDQLLETVFSWFKMIFQPPLPPPPPTARHEAQVLDHSHAERDEGNNDGWSLYRRMQILFSLKGLIITFVNRAAVLMSLECCITGRLRVLFQKAPSLNRIQASTHHLSSSYTSAGACVVCSLSAGHSETIQPVWSYSWADTSYLISDHLSHPHADFTHTRKWSIYFWIMPLIFINPKCLFPGKSIQTNYFDHFKQYYDSIMFLFHILLNCILAE